MPSKAIRFASSLSMSLALLCTAPSAYAQTEQPAYQPSWTDLVDLSDASQLVVRATIRKQAELEPERALGVAPGYTRLYIEAETAALISGNVPLGESLKYLVDVPLTEKGKAPKLKKNEVILFARAVPSSPGAIQLVARDAQLPWSADLEQRLRLILSALVASTAPPEVAGIRDALSAEGNLDGESETQIFLNTQTGDPLSLSVVRRPGFDPVWGVSYSEIVDQAVRAPQRGTLNWYRLACFLPRQIPTSAHLTQDPADRARAEADYRFVLQQLGACGRTRVPPQDG